MKKSISLFVNFVEVKSATSKNANGIKCSIPMSEIFDFVAKANGISKTSATKIVKQSSDAQLSALAKAVLLYTLDEFIESVQPSMKAETTTSTKAKSAKQPSKKAESKTATKAKSTKQPSKKAEKPTRIYAGKAFKALVGDKAYSLEEAVELVKGDATLGNKVEEFAAAQSISYADAVKGLASKVGYEFKPSKKASAKSSKSAKQSSKKTESKTSTKAKSTKQPSKKAEKPTRIYAGKAFKALVGDKAYSLEEAVELVKGDATLGNKVEEFAAAQSISYADAVKGLASKVGYEFKPSKKASAKSSKSAKQSSKKTESKTSTKAKSAKQPSKKAESKTATKAKSTKQPSKKAESKTATKAKSTKQPSKKAESKTATKKSQSSKKTA